jgi:hypothetical protein
MAAEALQLARQAFDNKMAEKQAQGLPKTNF